MDFNDKNVLNVGFKAAIPFKSTLSQHQINSCVNMALLKASQKFDPSFNVKFTSYFYNAVRFECLNQVRVNKRQPKFGGYIPNRHLTNNLDFDRIDMLDEIHSICDDPDLVYQYIYENRTIKEIAKSRGDSYSRLLLKLKKNLTKIKEAGNL